VESKKTDHEVIIVGAGPVGLCTALALARAGRQVLVLEKNPTTHDHSRAPAIWPRTQEILDGLGVLEDFLENGIRHETVTLWDGDQNPPKPVISFPLKELSSRTKHTQLLILPQSETERLLYEALLKHSNASLLFNTEVEEIFQTEEHVKVRFQKEGKTIEPTGLFLVGADGAHSVVRKALGFSLEGETYPMNAVLADVKFPGTDFAFSPRFSTKDFLCLAIQIRKEVWRLILPFEEKNSASVEARIHHSVKNLFQVSSPEIIWKSEFHLHRRMSTGLLKGRCVLAGDAAHLNSPVGGEGMNSGIQDTEILSRCLIEALNENSPAPLEEYVRQRRPASGKVNRFTHFMTMALMATHGRGIKGVLQALRLILKIRPLRKKFLLKIAMFD